MPRTLRRFAVPVAFVLLFLLVSNPAARAASGRGVFPFTEWLEMLTRLWAHGNSAPSRDEGCGFDPGGKCSTTPIWAPGGCILDPSGGCRDNILPQRDGGCGIDPGGNCAQ